MLSCMLCSRYMAGTAQNEGFKELTTKKEVPFVIVNPIGSPQKQGMQSARTTRHETLSNTVGIQLQNQVTCHVINHQSDAKMSPKSESGVIM